MKFSLLKTSILLIVAVGLYGLSSIGAAANAAVNTSGAPAHLVATLLGSNPIVWIEQKVTASGGQISDRFGAAVVIDGSTAFVSAPCSHLNPNTLQCGPGAVYVFIRSKGAWTQTAKLTASDGVPGSGFGVAMAVEGATVLIGAPGASDGSTGPGAVYVFSESGGSWMEAAKLSASDSVAGDRFGVSVAFAGTTAVIGEPSATVNSNSGQGAAYVFVNSAGGWNEVQKLTSNNGNADDAFGRSVAVSGGTILVGATSAGLRTQGAVYVFDESGGAWSQAAEIVVVGGTVGAGFGGSIAFNGALALVGAPSEKVDVNFGQGAAYLFDKQAGTWVQVARLTANDGAAQDFFGFSVALNDGAAIIGEPSANIGGKQRQGAAYVFTSSNGNWGQTQKLTASDGTEFDHFGGAVALSGTTAIVGVPGANPDAAYFYGVSALGLTVSSPGTVPQGQSYLSQVIATNKASTASPAIAVAMDVSNGTDFVSAVPTQGDCSIASKVVTCNFGSISGNAGTAKADIKLKPTGSIGDIIRNTANVVKATPKLTAGASVEIVKAPPVASDGTLTTDENTPASGTLVASDPDGDPLSFSIVGQPGHGTVTLDDPSTGAYTYTPSQDFSGSDSFTFKANDGQADSNTATISITVNAASPPPPPPSPGGGGATGPLGLAFLALAGLLVCLRRKL